MLVLDTKSNMTLNIPHTFLLLDTIINQKTVKLIQLDTMPAVPPSILHL